MTNRRAFITSAIAVVADVALPSLVRAQAYPARPIKYICPWPAGGSTDAVIRALAESTGKTLGQTIIVDNKPGAGGMLGAIEMLNTKPDGYTLTQFSPLVEARPNGIAPHLEP